MTSTTKRPHVLIVGAGLGGMTLAQSLRKQGITFEIFERDTGLHSRSQGWAIALHKMLADFKASMPEDLGGVEGTSHLLPLDLPAQFRMYRNDRIFSSTSSDSEHQIVRSNRGKLRDYLSAKLNIHWGKTFDRIEEHGDSVTLHFDDGSSATGDVLVGADGSHSRVRSYLYEGKDQLRPITSSIIVGEVRLNKEQYEEQLKLAHSAYIVMDGSDRLFVGLNAISSDEEYADYYWFQVVAKASAEEKAWAASASKQELYDRALEKSKVFGLRFSKIVRLSKPEGMITPPLVIKDIELDFMPNRRVTLLGDAAHAMAPNRGEGGNHAMQDALNLARAIANSEPDGLLLNLKNYQDEMLKRGNEAVRKSRIATEDDGSSTASGWGSWGKRVDQEAPTIEAH